MVLGAVLDHGLDLHSARSFHQSGPALYTIDHEPAAADEAIGARGGFGKRSGRCTTNTSLPSGACQCSSDVTLSGGPESPIAELLMGTVPLAVPMGVGDDVHFVL